MNTFSGETKDALARMKDIFAENNVIPQITSQTHSMSILQHDRTVFYSFSFPSGGSKDIQFRQPHNFRGHLMPGERLFTFKR